MKILFQILVFLLITLTAFAQGKNDSIPHVKNSKWVFGINGGINKSIVHEYSPYQIRTDLKNKISTHFSISAITRAKKSIGFRSNLCYDNIGYENTWLVGFNELYKEIDTYHVLNLDALVELHKNTKYFVAYSSTGLKSGYILFANQNFYIDNILKGSVPLKIQGFPFWWKLNAGVNFYIGNSVSLGLDLNYCYQLAPFVPENLDYTLSLFSVNFYSISCGIIYNISNKKMKHIYILKT